MVYGWAPVIASMFLSSLSGPISEASIQHFPTFACFQVVMNGAGGNLGAIFCSKLSTDLSAAFSLAGEPSALNAASRPLERALSGAVWATEQPRLSVSTSWVNMRDDRDYVMDFLSFRTIFGKGEMRRFCRTLMLLIVPGQAFFACIVVGVGSDWSALPSPIFLGFYILASLAQVIVLLMASRQLVVMFWRMELNPDNFSSPLVCGLGDLIGTFFMSLAYRAVSACGSDAWPGNI